MFAIAQAKPEVYRQRSNARKIKNLAMGKQPKQQRSDRSLLF
jgi:hypothetical protein